MPREPPAAALRAVFLAFLASTTALAGCATPDGPAREPVWVGPPDGTGGPLPCASHAAIEVALPGLRADAVNTSFGRGVGIHRLNETAILWVWADYFETQRQDRLARLNRVDVHREPSGEHVVCTSADLVAEVFADGELRTYAIGAVLTAPLAWPQGATHVVVNWVVGCSGCTPPLRGNTTAHLG